MCDYTSEEIQEVYRRQRRHKGVTITRLAVLKQVNDNLVMAIEAATQGVNILTGQPFNNWGTNERA